MATPDEVNRAAQHLAKLDHRYSADTHLRRAWEVVKEAGPLEQVDGRLLDHIESRIASKVEREAFRVRLQVYRRSDLPSEEVLAPARERVAAEGGISEGHAKALGYESRGDLTGEG
jgi:hypothetical protein